MSKPITIPTAAEIAERIRACRTEIAALQRLHRLASAAEAAGEARERPRTNCATVAQPQDPDEVQQVN
jgi:hypothetical protein